MRGIGLQRRFRPVHGIHSYQLYGMHPNILWAQIVADRKGKLGWEYDLWYFDDGRLKPHIVTPDYDPLCGRKLSSTK